VNRLAALIQKRYGKTRDDAELDMQRWIEVHRRRG
jgi:hypothetical protein